MDVFQERAVINQKYYKQMILYILIGISAYVFSRILLDPDMIFGWAYKYLEKLPKWLAKPLGLCEYCLAGQLAFWSYLWYNFTSYDLVLHVVTTSLSIFTVEVINVIMNLKNNN